MHPKVGEMRSVARFSLGDFIRVMNRNVIFAAAMNVKESTQVFGGHSGTFDVPSGKTDTPRAVPFHLPFLIGRAKLPQSKVGRVALFALINARSGLQAAGIQPSQVPIVGQVGSVKIDPVGCAVGEALCLDAADHFDLLWNVIGSLAPNRRFKNIQTVRSCLNSWV